MYYNIYITCIYILILYIFLTIYLSVFMISFCFDFLATYSFSVGGICF